MHREGFFIAKIFSVFHVLFEKPETNHKFDKQIKETDKAGIMNTLEYVRMEGREEGRKEGKEEGRKEGKEEGRAEERRKAVMALLANT
jgi:flagellar biosynthesis/type III secretory pathway protein FliH